MDEYERVYTVPDWYDGPRCGVADFHGTPHYFESQLEDIYGEEEGTFLLAPVSQESLQAALEDWAIWERWQDALYAGETDISTHPALPVDRAKHESLQGILESMAIPFDKDVSRATAEWRRDPDRPGRKHHMPCPLVVKWTVCPGRHRRQPPDAMDG